MTKGGASAKFMAGGRRKNCRSLDFARDDKGWGDASMKSGC
jgi:hypothetical protein